MPINTLRRYPGWIMAYAAILASGILGFIATPSPTLSQQGGRIILIAWGIVCTTGGILALLGLYLTKPLIESIGVGLCAVAGLVFSAALVLQAVATSSTVPLTAACVAGATTTLFAQRWVDAFQRPRR